MTQTYQAIPPSDQLSGLISSSGRSEKMLKTSTLTMLSHSKCSAPNAFNTMLSCQCMFYQRAPRLARASWSCWRRWGGFALGSLTETRREKQQKVAMSHEYPSRRTAKDHQVPDLLWPQSQRLTVTHGIRLLARFEEQSKFQGLRQACAGSV